jgi:predicted metal-binding membrane protein
MGDMEMPGGWTMSMMWMRMPGQTWPGAAASFLAMWIVMMMAMMLPSLVPILRRYRRTLAAASSANLAGPTAIASAGYFVAWTLFGIAVYPMGVALASLEMRLPALARAVPLLVGVVVVIAGMLQFSPWKAHQLACCRCALCGGDALAADGGAALRHGLRLGVRCCCCCANLMAILLVVGVMDFLTMAVVTIAITVERLAPDARRAMRAIGAVAVGAGLVLIARSVGAA